MGSSQSKPNETSAQPYKSRTAQFFRDEGIPFSNRSLFLQLQGAGASEASVLSHPYLGNHEVLNNPNQPQKHRRGFKSSWGKLKNLGKNPAAGFSTPALSAAPSSAFSGASFGITSAPSLFSQPSPASTTSSPPLSPFSSGGIRRNPIDSDPVRQSLRPAASSPSLLGAANSPHFARPPFSRPNFLSIVEDVSGPLAGDRQRSQGSLNRQWPLQSRGTSALESLYEITRAADSQTNLVGSSNDGFNVTVQDHDWAFAEQLQNGGAAGARATNSPETPSRSNGLVGAPSYAASLFGLPEDDFPLTNPWSCLNSFQSNYDELLAMRMQQEEEQSATLDLLTYYYLPRDDADMALATQLQQEEEEAERIWQENGRSRNRDCVVCSESISISEFPALLGCEHEPQICGDCYKGWIASELESKNWKEIKCPDSGCVELLKHADVRQYAAPDVYAKFDNLSAREALNDDPNFRWCRGAGCGSGQIHESGVEGNIFKCIGCGFKVCIIHDDTWHEGETCEEYDYRKSGKKEIVQKAQEEASVKAIRELTKKCPGKKNRIECGWNIEKNDGCDHMTCTRCKHEFCWICMAPYESIRKKGNASHNRNCKYHTSRIT